MASEDEGSVTDLAQILAPLSKEQLEFLVAKLVANHEELGEEVCPYDCLCKYLERGELIPFHRSLNWPNFQYPSNLSSKQ